MTTTLRRPAARLIVLLALALQLSGCAVPFPPYTASSSNIASLRSIKKGIELGEFSGAQASVSCRMQPISPDGGRTFAQYIRGAWNDELVISGPAGAGARANVTLNLKSVDVDCGMSTASWIFDVDVVVNGRTAFQVRSQRSFDGNLMGNVVMQRAYQAFVPAVQQLIAEIMAHPRFKAEVAG